MKQKGSNSADFNSKTGKHAENTESVLNNIDHLNDILRQTTRENLFLGTRNFD